jgi:hypothetical protein
MTANCPNEQEVAWNACYSALIAILFATAFALILLATWNGIGIDIDSTVYVLAARSINQGHGSSMIAGDGSYQPLVHYPPGLPLALAAGGLAGMEPVAWARWLNAALMGCIVALIAAMARTICNGSIAASAIAGTIAVFSLDLLQHHATVLSEPLAILLQFLSFCLAGVFLRHGSPLSLAVSCLFMAAAMLTRYATLPAAAVVALSLLPPLSATLAQWRRSMAAIAWGGLAVAPVFAWSLWAKFQGASTPRTLGFHPISFANIRLGLRTISMWAVPYFLPHAAAIAVLCVIVAAILATIWFLRLRRHEAGVTYDLPTDPLVRILGTYAVVYPVFLLGSITFADAGTQLISRILLPEYIALLLLAVRLGFVVWGRASGDARVRWTVGAVILGVLIGYVSATVRWVVASSAGGGGYAAKSWRESRLLWAIANLPPETPVYTNVSPVIPFVTGRPAYRTPLATSVRHDEEWVKKMRKDCIEKGGVVVYLRKLDLGYMMTEEDMVEALGMPLVARTTDGNVYMHGSHEIAIRQLQQALHESHSGPRESSR